ncbi:MAG: HAMP domain-containing protein [Blautia marasmi]
MRKKIKSSIFAKMFLSIGAILIITSLLIYGIVMFVTPQSYKAEANRNFSKNAEQLAEALQKAARDEAEKIITAFCLENNATVSLQGEGESLTFGKIDVLQKGSTENVGATQTVSSVIRFIDSDTPYSLMMAQGMKGVNEMAAVFKRLLPWIFLLIVLISIIGSFLCSRILARPVLQISRISKRMSELDMTWHCDVNRTDELGVLAKSLNTMAEKLNGTMSELEGANYQLQEDIKKKRAGTATPNLLRSRFP